jgi:hypothetical protein
MLDRGFEGDHGEHGRPRIVGLSFALTGLTASVWSRRAT